MFWTHVRAMMVTVSVGVLALGSVGANAQANYLTDLGAVAPGFGVNNNGQVVLQNYIYSNGTLTPFPTNFTGAAINSGGEVAGSDSNNSVGAVYTNGSVMDIPGAPGQAFGINDSGAIVGTNNLSAGLVHNFPTNNDVHSYLVIKMLAFTIAYVAILLYV